MAENILENNLEQDPPKGSSPFEQQFNQAMGQIVQDANPEPRPQTISERLNAPVGPSYAIPVSDDQINMYRYQDGFKEESFNPFDSSMYKKFADKETWGTALSKGFDSFSYKFGNSFSGHWASYGRMADALLSMDYSKMLPDEATMAEQYYNDQKDSLKNFVFEQPGEEDSLFSKRTVSEMIANTGYTMGTFAGIGIELVADLAITALSGGAGSVSFLATLGRIGTKEAVEQGVKAGARKAFSFTEKLAEVGRGFSAANKSADEISAASKIINQMDDASKIANASGSAIKDAMGATFDIFSMNMLNVAKSKTFLETASNLVKGVPVLGTAIKYGEKIGLASKAGATGAELVGMGLQGIRRTAMELNAAASEASFEAVTSYGDTLDKMVEDYKIRNNGAVPSSEEFQKMKALASKASAANYNTNMAILLTSNKIEFGNVFNKFIPANKYMLDVADNLLVVEGKAGSKIYRKGFFGTAGVAGKIAEDFGKREAAYQIGKSFLRGSAMKFSITEGIQENLQETSASAWRDYYASQYAGTGETLDQAFGKGFSEQFSKQGLKTFLMGAVTGVLTAGPTSIVSSAIDKTNRAIINNQYKDNPAANPIKQAEEQLDADLQIQNATFKQAREGKFDHKVFNFNAQTEAALQMNEAAAKGKRYEFENAKDNSLIAAVAAAKRTNSEEVLYRAIKNMGVDMTAEEFEGSFGVKLEDTGFSSPSEFTEDVASKLKKYSDTYDNIRNSVKSKLADPNMYKAGTREQFVANTMRAAQEDAIQILAMNALKGERTAERAKQVATDLLSVPGLNTSADYSIRTLTNAEYLDAEVGHLMGDIRVLEESLQAEGISSEDRKDLQERLTSKKEEMDLLKQWMGYFDSREAIVGENKEGEAVTRKKISDTFVGKRYDKKPESIKKAEELDEEDGAEEGAWFNQSDEEVIQTFRKLMNIKNKQAGSNTEISESSIRDGFQKVLDYINLDSDTRDYMRSVDILSNPDNFKLAQTRMADGKFKYNLITFVDNILMQAFLRADLKINELQITDEKDREAFITGVLNAVRESEAFKNLSTLAANPDITIDNNDYAAKLSDELVDIMTNTISKMVATYGPKDYTGDISEEEYDEIIATKKLEDARLFMLADKVAQGTELTEREQKVYTLFKQAIDEEAAKLEIEVPTTVTAEENPVDDTPPVGVVDAQGNLTFADEIREPIAEEEEDLGPPAGASVPLMITRDMKQQLVDMGYTREEVAKMTPQEANDILINDVRPARQTEAVVEPTPASAVPDQDEAQMRNEFAELMAKMGKPLETEEETVPEQEEPFQVEGTPEEGYNVVDRSKNEVFATNFETEQAAEEKAESLNGTRTDMDFARNLLVELKPDADETMVLQFHDRLKSSMVNYNKRKKQSFTTLEEYYKGSLDGKRLTLAIRESVVTGKPVNYGKKGTAVTVTPTENQPVLFNTTSSITGASLTLKSLEDLHSKVVEFRSEALQNTDKFSKFVEEGKVTEASIIADLQKITSCFS